MKISLQSRSLNWHPFLDFTLISNSLSPLLKKKLLLQKEGLNKWGFIHHYLEESKVENLYKKLHGIYRVSTTVFQMQQKLGHISRTLNPLEEQDWFIEFLKDEIYFFSCEEIWTILLNLEQRDKYVPYFEQLNDWQPFEIFIQNYWLHALNGQQLVDLFLFALEDETESSSLLSLFFYYLSSDQAFDLLNTLKASKPHPKDWELYCRLSLKLMRNCQIKKVVPLLALSLTEIALQKLYPCEVVEVIEDESHDIRKNHLIELVLNHYKTWWSNFCYEEVKETVHQIESLKQE